MEVAEFDRVADDYQQQHRANIAITGETPEYFADYKVKVLSNLVRDYGRSADSILDFGSGIGSSIPYFRRYLPRANLTCADVSQRSLDLAQARFAGMAQSLRINDQCIPATDDSFDVVFSACVFHHITHDEHSRWLRELHRVTRPGGMLVVFEHNPLNPLTVHAVNTCPFDRNARLIRARDFVERCRGTGWNRPLARYHLFFPRMLAGLRPFERHLSRIPFGAQYSVSATKAN